MAVVTAAEIQKPLATSEQASVLIAHARGPLLVPKRPRLACEGHWGLARRLAGLDVPTAMWAAASRRGAPEVAMGADTPPAP
jgi:hypothetical protein